MKKVVDAGITVPLQGLQNSQQMLEIHIKRVLIFELNNKVFFFFFFFTYCDVLLLSK